MSCEEETARVLRARGDLYSANAAYDNCTPNDEFDDHCDGLLGGILAAQQQLEAAEEALAKCEADPPLRPRILFAEGHVTFLRVHDPKTGGYGPNDDKLNGEVVFKLDSTPEKAFGFKLRDNNDEPARRGMLSLLEGALIHQIKVRAVYIEETPSQNNHRAFRIELRKPRPAVPDPRDPSTLIAQNLK